MKAVVAPLEPTRGVCDLTRLEVQHSPFPHVTSGCESPAPLTGTADRRAAT